MKKLMELLKEIQDSQNQQLPEINDVLIKLDGQTPYIVSKIDDQNVFVRGFKYPEFKMTVPISDLWKTFRPETSSDKYNLLSQYR